jgi:hypothetical protein
MTVSVGGHWSLAAFVRFPAFHPIHFLPLKVNSSVFRDQVLFPIIHPGVTAESIQVLTALSFHHTTSN